jgi:hypothetical protein
MKKQTNIEIIETKEFDDFAEIVEFENAATCKTKALNGYQIDIDVRATNDKNETKDFHIVFQSKERNNGMRAYNGYEMERADQYGCIADESGELIEFFDHDDDCLKSLYDIANDEAKHYLESNK